MIIFVSNNLPMVTSLLKKSNIVVWKNEQTNPIAYHEFTSNTLEHTHGIILEITKANPETHYLLSQAIILQKPTLCLYRKDNIPREILSHLAKKNMPRSIVAKSYLAHTIEHTVQAFLATIDNKISITETPTIKFTLRLTPALEQYIEWLARVQQLNKAEAVRLLLKQAMLDNVDYQRYLE